MKPNAAIKASIKPRAKDIGEFEVRRALPTVEYRSIGPWVFFDHFGPVDFAPGEGMNVRPHPHINLATVTYLFDGEIYHRDSLGNAQPILPGGINLMVAGKGIVHSERTRDALRATGYSMHGLQLWHALPEADEEVDPAFYHHPAQDIPQLDIDGVAVRVMMGTAYGVTSPVKIFSPNIYIEADLRAGQSLDLPKAQERGIYVVKGGLDIHGEAADVFAMSVLSDSATRVTATQDTRFALIGGDNLGKRHLDWNFVSSRKDRIAQAKDDWLNDRFPKVPGDSDEQIPLPSD